MNVIILAAGIGSRLYPLTKNTPKCLLKINNDETILGRTLSILKKDASEFHIRIIAGFEANQIIEKFDDIDIIVNPFFRITNSIASLWFSKDLLSDEVTIINADVCFNSNIFEMINNCSNENFVVLDSSKNCTDADYKIVVEENLVTDMGKSIPFDNFSGEYAGITHLNKEGASHLRNKLEEKLLREEYDTWYETAICELIKEGSMKVSILDIAGQNWIEVDSEKELMYAKNNL
ncbi:phosphocholine cytidylyltransferase family protein [Methanogenium organophilum]|uniref:Phosphocholine cytidylyltransferase family protein n=1 Tax=Methanogenium organophilum TaxID=2199 RepID=A0A9X9S3J1_METOG|nr:phosphocholine cytidylyltransferase family protein [Methanogenium organophilum]WAI00840.1 phosphocholine cytidylyltransferase family protein [Methanogenium organophilum]